MVNETINKKNLKKVKAAIEKNEHLSLTDIQHATKVSRCQVRILIAYLLGTKEIDEMQIGMAKVYNSGVEE